MKTSYYIQDSTGNYFTVEYNEETSLYHYQADSSYAGYTEQECVFMQLTEADFWDGDESDNFLQ